MSNGSPAQNSGLEVSPEDGLHYHGTSVLPETYQATHPGPNKTLQASPEQNKHFLNLSFRKTTFLLSLGFFVALILAVIAAAVGGYMAAKRQHQSCPNPANQGSSNATSAASSIPQPATTSDAIPPSTSTATQTSSTPKFTPTSDCSTLVSPYSTLGSQLYLYCNTDFPLHDLMSVYVYHLEDCMRACVSYNINSATHLNSTCAGVSFGYTFPYGSEIFWGGNCFMKATANIGGNPTNISDAALLVVA